MEPLLSVYHNSPVDLRLFEAILLLTSSDEWINTTLLLQENELSLAKHKSKATVKEIFWGEDILACSSKCSAAGRLDTHSVSLPASALPAWGHLALSFLTWETKNGTS